MFAAIAAMSLCTRSSTCVRIHETRYERCQHRHMNKWTLNRVHYAVSGACCSLKGQQRTDVAELRVELDYSSMANPCAHYSMSSTAIARINVQSNALCGFGWWCTFSGSYTPLKTIHDAREASSYERVRRDCKLEQRDTHSYSYCWQHVNQSRRNVTTTCGK
jgi:hypothetical protein